jgi:hypothetical protein
MGDFATKWDTSPSVSLSTTSPRFAGTAHLALSSINTQGLMKILTAAQEDDVLIVGRANWMDGGSDGGTTSGIFRFRSDSGVTDHVSITVTAAGEVRARRGNGAGTVLKTSAAGVIVFSIWQYVEARVKLHDTAGEVQVWVNGVLVLEVTPTTEGGNVDTKNSGTKTVLDAVTHGGGGGGTTVRGRDFYIFNEQGTENNGPVGDRRVYVSLPTADTAQEDFTPSAGSDSFAMVDDPAGAIADEDATYIESSTAGHVTRLALANLPADVTVVDAVQVTTRARKDDAGARTYRSGILSDATTANGETIAPNTGYESTANPFDLDPDGDVAWTVAAVNALELQVEVVA